MSKYNCNITAPVDDDVHHGADYFVIRLPWTTPPLSLNDRTHWAVKAKQTQTVRDTARRLSRGISGVARVRVTLAYTPRDKRRRDADNLVPVLKALCDGLVDAGVVTDDTPDYMEKLMPVINPPDPTDPRLTLLVEVLAE